MAYITNLMGMIFVDLIAVFTILSVAFIPGFSVKTRKILFNGVLYLTSATLLIYLGSFGPGLLYLLGITVFVILSLGKEYGYFAVGLNALICVMVGILLHLEIGNFTILQEYGLDNWIAVSSNLIFLSAVSVFIIPILFDGLQTIILKENKLRYELEIEDAELKKAVHQLHEKNQELEQFSYSISHDLKEPLRMIRNFLGLLERKYKEKLDKKAHEYIYFAVDGAERMQQLIDDLLDYSRVGRWETTKSVVDFNDILNDVQKNLSALTERYEAKICVDTKLPEIPVYKNGIARVFQNLISNGIKFHQQGEKPEIHISCLDANSHWQFAISDNGIGIPEDSLNEIFEIFRRLNSKTEYPGTGIGLAISKKIIEQHEGTIWVKSQENKGSTFYFTIKK
jgi:signal transduction histidine kinase